MEIKEVKQQTRREDLAMVEDLIDSYLVKNQTQLQNLKEDIRRILGEEL